MPQVFSREEQDRAEIPQVNLHPRFNFEFMGELRVHSGARGRQRLQGGWRFKRAIDQHASGGVRGFAARFTAFDYQHGRTPLAEGEGEREADDASADDDDVPSLHVSNCRGVETRRTPRPLRFKLLSQSTPRKPEEAGRERAVLQAR